jgi:hypothetical protein
VGKKERERGEKEKVTVGRIEGTMAKQLRLRQALTEDRRDQNQ